LRHTKGNCFELGIYGKEQVEKILPYLNPPLRDLEAMRAWVAGFFDAEGCVSIRTSRPSEVSISNTDIELLQRLKDFLTCIGVPTTLCFSQKVDKRHPKLCGRLTVLVPQTFYAFVKPYCRKKIEKLAKVRRNERARFYKKVMFYDGKLFIPVKDIEIVGCDSEWFYDLANTDRHAYSASGMIVSNSWAITALSKPPKKTGKHIKIPYLAKPYMLLTAKQQTIDQLIANKWEVTNAKAAINLTATILGPFPLELYGQFKTATGWENYG
jgi:hypothetical protein